MSKGSHHIFALVIYFLGVDWHSKHIKIGLFEAIENIGEVLVRNLITLLDEYGLRKKIVTYIKDEKANLNGMKITLKFVVRCEILGLDENFQKTCFVHAFSKAYQYETTKEKVCKDLKYVSIKDLIIFT